MIQSIQVLRGIAALLVLVFHFNGSCRFISNPSLNNLFSIGFMGVNLFFIISGFIMYTVTSKDTSPYTFISKRLIRIVPIYWLILLTHEGVDSFKGIDTIKSMFFIPLSSDNPPFLGYATLVQGWTLNYEMFFYLLLFIAIFFGKYRYTVVLGSFTIFHLLFWHYSGVEFKDSFSPMVNCNLSSPYLSMILNPLSLLFIVGILLGYLYSKFKDTKPKYHIIVAILSLIIIISMGDFLAKIVGNGHGLITSFYSILLFIMFLSMEYFIVSNKISLKIVKPFVYLGTISYSIYLTHNLIITKILKLTDLSQMNTLIVTVVVTIIVSSITYYFIENKFSKFLTTQYNKLCKLKR